MAYTPVGWQTGDTITAERLNRMDRGWDVVVGTPTQLFSETVTAAGGDSGMYGAELTYSQLIDAASIIVTYDGTEYECPSIGAGEYGAPYNDGNPDFTEFPFNLYTDSGNPASLVTQTAGEHTIAVTAAVTSIETSTDFDAAVSNVFDMSALPFRLVSGTTTADEINAANNACRIVYFKFPDSPKTYFLNTMTLQGKFLFNPELTGYEAKISNGVFTVVESQ